MHKRRRCDEWMWETLGDGTRLSIYHEAELDKNDLRHQRFDVDVEKWTKKKQFWTPWEAACISFYRDPSKVEQAIDEIVSFDDSYDDGKSKELQDNIEELCALIESAQSENYLTKDFFRQELFVDWAKRTGVDIPPFIPNQLELAERNRVRWIQFSETHEKSEDQGVELRKKLENSYLKIIAELWEMVEFDHKPISVNDLTTTIGSALEKKAKKNKAFELGDDTIRKHLTSARDRFKNNGPK